MLWLKSITTISSKAYRSCLHIQNFITKTFASVSNESSPILVTLSCVKNDKNSNRKAKEKTENNRKGYFKALCVIHKRNKTYDWTYVKITNASEILNLVRYYDSI